MGIPANIKDSFFANAGNVCAATDSITCFMPDLSADHAANYAASISTRTCNVALKPTSM